MAVDLSEYKQAIADAYEGRAVRDAIVAMVQAVENAINSSGSGVESRVSTLESSVSTLNTKVSGTDGLETKVATLNTTIYSTNGLGSRVGALEGSFSGFTSATATHFENLDDMVGELRTTVYGREQQDGLSYKVENLDDRVTALEGGGN